MVYLSGNESITEGKQPELPKIRHFDGSDFWPDCYLETDKKLPYGSFSSVSQLESEQKLLPSKFGFICFGCFPLVFPTGPSSERVAVGQHPMYAMFSNGFGFGSASFDRGDVCGQEPMRVGLKRVLD